MKKELTIDDIEYISKGSAVLGSGGGGSTDLGYLACVSAYNDQGAVELTALDELSDEEMIVFMGHMGAPSVVIEKIPSKEEWLLAFEGLQEFRDEQYSVVAPLEFGGANGPFTIAIAAHLKKTHKHLKLADIDSMGRANPRITDTLPYLNGSYDVYVCALASGRHCEIITAANANDLETKAREATTRLGGVATIACMPMSVKEAKKQNEQGVYINCVPNAISTALCIGKALSASNCEQAIKSLNHVCVENKLGYSNAKIILTGKIIDVKQNYESGFTIGYFDISNDQARVRVYYQNENLLLYDIEHKTRIEQVPNIISVLDKEMEIVSCGNYFRGMEVSLFTLQVPDFIWSESAKISLRKSVSDDSDLDNSLSVSSDEIKSKMNDFQNSENKSNTNTSNMGKNILFQSDDKRGVINLWVDVGGTNTHVTLAIKKIDCVATILESVHAPTTSDITSGICQAIKLLFEKKPALEYRNNVRTISLGTTIFVNSILEDEGLNPVLVLVLGGPAGSSISPLTLWPEKLRKLIGKHVYLCVGGNNYSGEPYQEINEADIRAKISNAKNDGIKYAAVIGVFSIMYPNQEDRVKKMCQEAGLEVTCSSELGNLGLVKRINSVTLNAALQERFKQFRSSLSDVLKTVGLNDCTIILSQNDGTCKPLHQAMPILTFDSGTTNSMIGGGLLMSAGQDDLSRQVISLHDKNRESCNVVVVDIGGSSTDVGGVISGIPVNTFSIKIGGIPCDIQGVLKYSIALGGGSVIDYDAEKKSVSFGKKSIAHQLKNKSLAFGGCHLTLTDIAIKKGRIQIEGSRADLVNMGDEVINAADDLAHQLLINVINDFLPKMFSIEDVKLVFVGGGAKLFDPVKILKSLNRRFVQVEIPSLSQSTSAVGAGGIKISGRATIIEYYGSPSARKKNREEAIKKVEKKAKKAAVKFGANPGQEFRLQHFEEQELLYLPNTPVRLICTMSGDGDPIGECQEIENFQGRYI